MSPTRLWSSCARYRRVWTVMLVLVAATAATPAELERAQPSEVGLDAAVLARIRPTVQALIDQGIVPGTTVMVGRRGKVVYEQRIGFQDIADGTPVPADAIYRMYSMTKPITGVCLMMLVERGLVNVDDPVAKYLPGFADLKVAREDGTLEPANRAITVRDLMRHTAGLTYGFMSNTKADEAYREAGILRTPGRDLADFERVLATMPLAYQPGTHWHYSVGVDVQGRIIEVVSGKALDEFMRENLFEPLDMHDTGFYVPSGEVGRLMSAYGRERDRDGLTVTETAHNTTRTEKPTLLSGGGGLVSTARDYFRFAMMLANGGELDGVRILKPETIREMGTDHLPEGVRFGWGEWRVDNIGFGLDFSVRKANYEPKIQVGEFGWDGAASTDFWVNPNHDGLVTMTLQQVQPYDARLEDAVKAIVYDAIVDEGSD